MHGGIDGGGTVVSAVPGERSHRPLDLIEQRRDFGGIVTVAIGQGGGDDPTGGGVDPDAQLLPGSPLCGSMPFNQPFTRSGVSVV